MTLLSRGEAEKREAGVDKEKTRGRANFLHSAPCEEETDRDERERAAAHRESFKEL